MPTAQYATIATGLVLLASIQGCAPQAAQSRTPAVSTAAALASADATTAPTADTLAAIADARRIVTENIAHADATGYKRTTATVNAGLQPTLALDVTQGALKRTERALDIAIQGDGFLPLKSPTDDRQTVYTRNGNLFINAAGNLVVAVAGDRSYELTPSINVPQGTVDVTISQDGVITVNRRNEAKRQNIGQLKLAVFPNPEFLRLQYDGTYTSTPMSGSPVIRTPGENGAGQVLQCFLEASNVQLDREQLRLDFLDRWRDTMLRAADGARPTSTPPLVSASEMEGASPARLTGWPYG